MAIEHTVEYFALHPEQFRELSTHEKLQVVADIAHYWAMKKIDVLENESKTRVESSIEAQRCYMNEKYWRDLQTNIRRISELEAEELRRGLA